MTHKFEKAGLGKAPFRCVGVSEEYIRYPDGTTKAAGNCDFCGTGIRWAYKIISSDKRHFVVGCDCVEKVGGDVEEFASVKAEHVKARKEVATAKAKEKRKVINDAIVAGWAAARLARYEIWKANHLELSEQIASYIGDSFFILSMRTNLATHGSLTDRQVEVVTAAIEAEKVKVDNPVISMHIGQAGDKVVMNSTVLFSKFLSYTEFYPPTPKYIVKLVTETGAQLTWFTSREYAAGTKFTKFTVKKHNEYNGVKDTIVNYVK